MRHDLHMMEQIYYRGRQELVKTPAPQLEGVIKKIKKDLE